MHLQGPAPDVTSGTSPLMERATAYIKVTQHGRPLFVLRGCAGYG
jgi:hypothetical protein